MNSAITGACLLLVSLPAWAGPAAASRPSQGDILAAESLRTSARVLIHAPPDEPGRAGRLVALVRFADSLVPADPDTSLLLASIYESQGRLEAASEALAGYLRRFPDDFVQQVRRIRLAAGAMQTAAQREALFKAQAERKDAPAAVRAEAAANWGRILFGKGDTDQARRAYRLALRHDPHHPGALGSLASMDKDAAGRVKALISVLRSNPANAAAAREVGGLLGQLGVYDQALRLLNHMAHLVVPQPRDRAAEEGFLLLGLSAALDAGQAPDAITTFLPKLAAFPDSPDLHALLIEAYRMTGQEDKARQLTLAMESLYKRLQARAAPGALAKDLAWFYLEILPKPQIALRLARQAAKADPNDPIVQRVLGVAELKAGNVEKGTALLKKLLATDVYAAVHLAEHYIEAGRREDASKVITAASALPRDGAGFRRMNALAAAQGITLPPAAGAAEARKAAEALPEAYLELVRTPERFLAVTMRAAKDKVPVGEQIRVEATLANIGEIDITVGPGGLFNPVLALRVTAKAGRRTETFTDLPLLLFPAPRYLKKGQSVSGGVAVGVGALRRFLAARPLDDVELTVAGILSPVRRGRRIASAMPGIRPSGLTIVRAGLTGGSSGLGRDAWARQYRLALGRIVFDLRRGKLPARMRAARQVGALLGLARLLESPGRAAVPPPPGRIDKNVLLRMMVEVMRDKSEAVRAEMLAAMEGVKLDPVIINLLAPAISDPSPLVRCRLVELLGASGLPGQEQMIAHLAKGGGPMVELMAAAFRPAEQPRPTGSGESR